MPDHRGYRAKSRDIFSKTRRGMPKPSSHLRVFKLGDYVTIKMDPSVHKGMAHRIYHGKTGIVWNVTRNAVGVILKKRVGNKYRTKKLSVRTEHVRKCGCQSDFIRRKKFNAEYRKNHKKDPKKFPKIMLKRQPKGVDGEVVVDMSKNQLTELKLAKHVDVLKM